MNTMFSRFLALGAVISLMSASVFAYSVPEEVQNPTASEKDGNIYLEWDPGFSADDVIIGYKIYYGVNSVQTEDDFYDNEIVTGVETNYTFEGLEKGVPYFFAVTALDSQENESATYSKEASFVLAADEVVVEPEQPVIEEPVIEEPIIEEPIIEEPVIETPSQQVEASESIDTIAPLDATALKVDTTNLDNGVVTILWTKSRDLDYDVQDQVIFMKKGLAPWDGGVSVGKNIEQMRLDVEPNQNYEIRVITIDQSGNESEGVSVVFSTQLAQSGAGSYMPFLIGATIMLFFIAWKRRA